MYPVPSLDVTWFCLAVSVTALALAAAVGALAVMLNRRVAELAAELAGVSPEGACPDRERIDALESYARGTNGQWIGGRHAAQPRQQPARPRPAPRRAAEGLLAAPVSRPPPERRW